MLQWLPGDILRCSALLSQEGGRPAHELLFNDFERLLDTLASCHGCLIYLSMHRCNAPSAFFHSSRPCPRMFCCIQLREPLYWYMESHHKRWLKSLVIGACLMLRKGFAVYQRLKAATSMGAHTGSQTSVASSSPRRLAISIAGLGFAA